MTWKWLQARQQAAHWSLEPTALVALYCYWRLWPLPLWGLKWSSLLKYKFRGCQRLCKNIFPAWVPRVWRYRSLSSQFELLWRSKRNVWIVRSFNRRTFGPSLIYLLSLTLIAEDWRLIIFERVKECTCTLAIPNAIIWHPKTSYSWVNYSPKTFLTSESSSIFISFNTNTKDA